MTPKVLRSTAFAAALVAGALAMTATIAQLAGAQDSTDLNDPITLRGTTQAQRAAMLREEFNEHQREMREAAEARRHHKRAHGKKVEQYVDQDYTPGQVGSKFNLPHTFTAPTNVKANNKAGDAAGAGQAEESPVFVGQNGLVEWNDGQGFNLNPQDVMGFGWSIDGGATWTDGGIPTKGGTITRWTSDPSVTANEKTGDFYLISLTANTIGTAAGNGIGVVRGHFAGVTFIQDATTVASSALNSAGSFDKEWMAADSSNGNLYATYTLFTATGDGIWFVRSTDNGATWSVPLQVSAAWENGLVSGSRPVVGPNGEVYVAYSAIGAVDADSLKIAKSTNGGATFGPSVVAMTEYDAYFSGAPGFNRARAVTFPSVAVDRSTGPNRGRVYMTVQDCVNFYNDSIGGGTSTSEVENNNNFANATPFTINQTLRGAMSAATDRDVWTFPATQGTTYIFFVDSLRTAGLKYNMDIFCPHDTTTLARLAFSGDASTQDATNQNALVVWTAPTSENYYLRITGVASTGGYRIRTGLHVPVGSDVARDMRDITVASSADGVNGWTPRVRVNDDAGYLDNWLPEVAVPCDGKAYVMWFDWRDNAANCFAGSNIYVSRSLDAGLTWAPNQVVTTAPTPNWLQVASNIAPNQGDYNGFYGGDALAFAFADGRLGDADVFAARIPVHSPVAGCPSDQVVFATNSINGTANLSNPNIMFDNDYNYTISTSTNWPGFPASGTLTVLAGSSGNIPWSITVPDTAADGEVVHVCITASQNGACVDQCCFNITVANPATPTLLSLFDVLQDSNGGVDLSWSAQSKSIVGWNVYRGTSATAATDRVNATRIPVSANGTYTLHDDAGLNGMVYYRLAAVLGSGLEVDQGTVAVELSGGAPHAFSVALAGGNPFRGRTSVSLALPTPQQVSVEVFNVAGQRVATLFNGPAQAGNYSLPLSLAHSGVYLVSVKAGPYSKVLRVTSLQ